MQHFYGKFAISQSNATISVAYNRYCNLLLITSFMIHVCYMNEALFHKTYHQKQVLNFYGKFAISQSNATISVAYKRYCKLFWITSFMKRGPSTWIPNCLNQGHSSCRWIVQVWLHIQNGWNILQMISFPLSDARDNFEDVRRSVNGDRLA